MSVHATLSFDGDLERAIYEYVDRNGPVTPDELARSIRIDAGPTHSKPARSGAYADPTCPPAEDLESCLERLQAAGYLTETNGHVRIDVSAAPTTHEVGDGTVTIRPARQQDRDGVLETMHEVADDGPHVGAESIATRLERESALVRANEDRSRVCFAAVYDADGTDDEREVVGWLHVDAAELPAVSHTAELTVGVANGHRRAGIGSTLLEYANGWAADAGYRKLYQHVPATNDAAIAFLEENGWEREGVHEEQYRIDGAFVDELMLATWP